MAFSEKQRQIMRFPYTGYDALICDGAVRSGKTSIMSLSFFLWAMGNFNNCAFAFCGKSVGAVERNIVMPLLSVVYLKRHFSVRYNRGDHVITASRGARENRFYLFGGKDESSYTLIQGVTLAGVLLDEVALMPRSFVEQALARCSVSGAKMWFNCNPENPLHWFRQEWILKAPDRNALHLHFLMDDNPGLDEDTKRRYKNMYSGVFYQRYILGQWVMSEGLIYDMFDHTANTYRENIPSLPYSCQRYIACDYGTTNPTVFLDIYDDGEIIRVDREYRWDSRKERRQKTDQEYADDFVEFMGDVPATVLVDPSAASFIVALRQRGVYVREADNDVLDGIRKTGVAGREVKSPAEFFNQNVGQYSPEEPVSVFQRGCINVKCQKGSPAIDGTVYVRVTASGNYQPGGFEAEADGTNTVALVNAQWNGPADNHGVAELRIAYVGPVPTVSGSAGEDGGYYQPSVSEAGELTWTASKEGMPAVASANIMGPQGPKGDTGETGPQGPAGENGGYYTPTVDTSGNLSWAASKEGMPAVTGANIRGPQGEQGPQGPAGQDGAQGPAGQDGAQGPEGPQGPAGPSYTLPDATTSVRGGVLQMAAIADLTAAPTQQDFNNLLAALRTAGMLANS